MYLAMSHLSPALLATLITHTTATYTLTQTFEPSTFFSAFDFFTSPDPTHGTVDFVDAHTASATNLTSTFADSVFIGVDHTNIISPTQKGRPSIRIESKATFNRGLLITDVLHMPGSVCGAWPALWMVGPDWPAGGEIDILEGVNMQEGNAMTLHTSANCAMQNSTDTFTGQMMEDDCFIDGSANYKGCQIAAPAPAALPSSPPTYGTAFNAAGGAVVAMQWTSSAISIWILPRDTTPSTLNALSTTPDPTLWGTPLARFSGSCDIDSHFKDMKIVIDTTFCGEWAGQVWKSGGCAASTGVATCEEYVKTWPEAFGETFWKIGGMKWFEDDGSKPKESTQQRLEKPTMTGPPLRQFGNGSVVGWVWRNGTTVSDVSKGLNGTATANSTGMNGTGSVNANATALDRAHGTGALRPRGTGTATGSASVYAEGFRLRIPPKVPAPKPIAPIHKPSGTTQKPIESTHGPVESTLKSTESTSKTMASSSKSTGSTHTPVASTLKSTGATYTPIAANHGSAASTRTPIASKAIDLTYKPLASTQHSGSARPRNIFSILSRIISRVLSTISHGISTLSDIISTLPSRVAKFAHDMYNCFIYIFTYLPYSFRLSLYQLQGILGIYRVPLPEYWIWEEDQVDGAGGLSGAGSEVD